MTSEAAVTNLVGQIEDRPSLQPQRDHLAFLDGLRGAAALFVVIHHAYMQLNWQYDGGGLSAPVKMATWILRAGNYGVVVFIVLSGYCLMLPVARTPGGVLRGGWASYLFRRCRRIMPPYYAALVATLLLIWLVPGLSRTPAFFADSATPVTTGALISHLLMIHNINPDWHYKIDPPMWSVAVEFQIYLLLPTLFLPIYRRWGVTAVVVISYALVAIFTVVTHGRYDYSQPHFVGLFCLGMLAADVTVGRGTEVEVLRRLPWQMIAGVAFLIAAALVILNPPWAPRSGWAPHTFFGIATTGGLIACGLNLNIGRIIRRLLEARWLVGLSSFSYSLYLVHLPVESLMFMLLKNRVHSADWQLVTSIVFSVPLACLAAFGFYYVFEKPFLRVVVRHQML